ncbi:MAG: iron ABC transporter permease [Bacteroidales bacterium]|nr:iron ABC transporter permease [Bacteroidales bacterium]
MKYILLTIIALAAAAACLFSGSVDIPASQVFAILRGEDVANAGWSYIVWQMRLPAMLTAALTGAALGVCGLVLQTFFRNPLAGPSILGITNGANLAVAVVIVVTGSHSGADVIVAAMIGSLAVLLLLLGIGRVVKHPVTLLIVGILLSYLASAVLTLIHYEATTDGVQALLIWGMGSFQQVGMTQMPLYASLILAGMAGSLALIRPMNGWMLGELYARNLGISTGRVRWGILIVTGLLCAATTAWCGPIAFIGLSIPHVARMMFSTDDHRTLLPATMLLGAICTMLCLWLSTLPADGKTLPINALTPLFGIPVILWVLLRKN